MLGEPTGADTFREPELKSEIFRARTASPALKLGSLPNTGGKRGRVEDGR